MKSVANGVPNPMTPAQSTAQVLGAATDVSHVVARPVASAHFSHSSCNDQGEAPFGGVVDIYSADASVHIAVYGECRDVTTTKAQAGISEDITLT